MEKKQIEEIRSFTDKSKISDWLPSYDGYSSDNFKNTFNIPTTDDNGKPAHTSINIRTNFDQAGIDDKSISRFYLILYCLQNDPYAFNNIGQVLDYKKDSFYYTPELKQFFADFQTLTNKKEQARSLTFDHIKFYRPDQFVSQNGSGYTLDDIPSIREYCLNNNAYNKNVIGILGKVTYDSVVKHTLYSLLYNNDIISKDFQKAPGISWSTEAGKLQNDQINFFIDVGGGPYSRSFPVICVYTKAASGQSESSIKTKAYDFLKSKFFREVSEKELVEPIDLKKESDKNFIELPVRDTGDSTYCVLFDFAKVILLDAKIDDHTLDLLKISLSFFSRKRLKFSSTTEFQTFYDSIQKYLESSFNEEIEKNNFKVCFKKKHTEECAYSLNITPDSISAKLDVSFAAEVKLLFDSLDKSYSKIINIFQEETSGTNKNFQFKNYPQGIEYPITLHFDNFYNLLAVTSENLSPSVNKKEYDKNLPFDISKYDTKVTETDWVKLFFQDPETLPKISSDLDPVDYQFSRSIAYEQDIAIITDVFLRETYQNLEEKIDGLIYETSKNQYVDGVLKQDSINLLELIKDRVKLEDDLKREDFFIVSNNKIFLKKDIIKKLDLNDLVLLFTGTKEDKIKFQTISHLLFINKDELQKRNLTVDDFTSRIYYPILNFETSAEKETPNTPPRKEASKTKNPNNDFRVNNIITSELACYGDIIRSFDKALNSKDPKDKVYYAFQALAYIGLPILLALAAQSIANKLAELQRKGKNIDPSLLECLLEDSGKLKKNILGYAELAALLRDPRLLASFLSQEVVGLTKLPNIAAFVVFDSEKELKRRIILAIINLILQRLRDSLKASLMSLADMCNSDSYLMAFLNSSDAFGSSAGTANASGLPNGTSSTIYIPAIKADINILIDQSQIETRHNVYEYFRKKYLNNIPDSEISLFFEVISDAIDAGEVASLLRDSSTLDTRLVVLSKIKNYTNQKFYNFINDDRAVEDLFIFLSNYIDYTLCYGLINNNLNNYVGTVCDDTSSRFDQNALYFGEIAIADQIADLSKSLDEICRTKNPVEFDLLTGGPSLLTKTLRNSLTITYENYANQASTTTKGQIVSLTNLYSKKDAKLSDFQEKFLIDVFKKDLGNFIDEATYYKLFIYELYVQIYKNLAAQGSIFDVINKNLSISLDTEKEKYASDLNSAGNVGLKTELSSFDGYVRKYNQLKNVEIFNIKDTLNQKKLVVI